MKDQDDCSKRLLCELNAKAAGGETLTENEELIAQVFHFLFAFVCLFVYLFVCLFAQVFQVFTCCFLFVRFPIQLIVDVQHVNPGFWKEQQP